VRGLVFGHDGQTLCQAIGRRFAALVGRLAEPWPQPNSPAVVYAVAISRDEKLWPRPAAIKSCGSGTPRPYAKDPLGRPFGPIYGLSFNHDGSRLASVAGQNHPHLGRKSGLLIKSGKDTMAIFGELPIRPTAQVGDRRTRRRRKTVNAESGQLWQPTSATRWPFTLWPSIQDGKCLASGGRDGAVRSGRLSNRVPCCPSRTRTWDSGENVDRFTQPRWRGPAIAPSSASSLRDRSPELVFQACVARWGRKHRSADGRISVTRHLRGGWGPIAQELAELGAIAGPRSALRNRSTFSQNPHVLVLRGQRRELDYSIFQILTAPSRPPEARHLPFD